MSEDRVLLSLPVAMLGSVLVHLAENYGVDLTSTDDGTLVTLVVEVPQ